MWFRIFSQWHVHQDFQLVMLLRVRAVCISEVQVHSLDDADQIKPSNNNKVLFTVCVRISHFWCCCGMHRHASVDLSSSSPATPSPVPHLLSDIQSLCSLLHRQQSVYYTHCLCYIPLPTKCLTHRLTVLHSITDLLYELAVHRLTVLHSITNQSVTGAGNTQPDCVTLLPTNLLHGPATACDIMPSYSMLWCTPPRRQRQEILHKVQVKANNMKDPAEEQGLTLEGPAPRVYHAQHVGADNNSKHATGKAGTKHSLSKLSAQRTNKGNQKNRCFPFKGRLKSTAEMLETKVCLICQYRRVLTAAPLLHCTHLWHLFHPPSVSNTHTLMIHLCSPHSIA